MHRYMGYRKSYHQSCHNLNNLLIRHKYPRYPARQTLTDHLTALPVRLLPDYLQMYTRKS